MSLSTAEHPQASSVSVLGAGSSPLPRALGALGRTPSAVVGQRSPLGSASPPQGSGDMEELNASAGETTATSSKRCWPQSETESAEVTGPGRRLGGGDVGLWVRTSSVPQTTRPWSIRHRWGSATNPSGVLPPLCTPVHPSVVPARVCRRWAAKPAVLRPSGQHPWVQKLLRSRSCCLVCLGCVG